MNRVNLATDPEEQDGLMQSKRLATGADDALGKVRNEIARLQGSK